MSRPILTLTTDFGLSDHYVGTMKGVIASRCPEAAIIDITHLIPPFSLTAAAYAIAQASPYFPAGTVHVIVVDPGVGTARRSILLEADESFFIAPDNGVLSLILARSERAVCREIAKQDLWLPEHSATFHGRDIFAPTAAALAAGAVLAQDVGPVIEDPLLLADLEPLPLSPITWQGIILSIDHFGNVITNFPAELFETDAGRAFQLEAGKGNITKLYATFGEAPDAEPFAYWGSSGYLEIGINLGDAAQVLGVAPGDVLLLHFRG